MYQFHNLQKFSGYTIGKSTDCKPPLPTVFHNGLSSSKSNAMAWKLKVSPTILSKPKTEQKKNRLCKHNQLFHFHSVLYTNMVQRQHNTDRSGIYQICQKLIKNYWHTVLKCQLLSSIHSTFESTSLVAFTIQPTTAPCIYWRRHPVSFLLVENQLSIVWTVVHLNLSRCGRGPFC